jgi:ferrous iron transport protein A
MSDASMLPLDCLQTGEWADVAEVAGEPGWICRMAELGLRSGSRIQMLQSGTPCMLQVAGCRLCLRGDAASQVFVRLVNEYA